jgi:predicted outer membrane repeat protein
MFCENSSPTITNCTFSGNSASGRGGGIGNEGSSPTVTNCTFSGNSATSGGGMCCQNSNPTITNCTFSGNSASANGGGMYNYYSSPTMTNCILWENSDSGGMDESAQIHTNLTVDDMESYTPWTIPGNNIFETWRDGMGNCTSGNGNDTGSNVYENPDPPGPVLTGIQSMKYDFDNDGLVYNPCTETQTVRPYLYSKIEAQTFDLPSGIGSDWTASGVTTLILPFHGTVGNATTEPFWVQLQDITGYGTKVFYGDQPGENLDHFGENSWHYWNIPLVDFAVDLNNIVSVVIGIGEEGSEDPGGSGTIYIDDIVLIGGCINYSCVQGWTGSLCGTGNINADPCFVDADANDFRLLYDSPCIDAGDNNSVPNDIADLDNDGNTAEPIPYDLDGHPRLVDGDCNDSNVVDMGAYEFAWAYIGDFDGECDVDFADWGLFAMGWLKEQGEAGYVPDYDISIPADNKINWADVKVFCDNWLCGK